MTPLPVKYKWDNFSSQKFTEVLNSPSFKEKLLHVENDVSCDSDEILNNFNNIIHEVCEVTLKK